VSTKQGVINWFSLGSDHVGVGEFPAVWADRPGGGLLCPICGHEAQYNKDVISHEYVTGKDIYGWWYDCYSCMIGTEASETAF
jgi:hypothetical protein